MKKYSFTPHTADVRLVVEGSSKQELFEAALEGMADFIVPRACSKEGEKIEASFEVSSPDITSLLIDTMSEILTLSHIYKGVFCAVTFDELTETHAKGVVTGVRTDAFEEDVKAVTYHEANVIENEAGNLSTVVVFDI